MLPTLLKKGMLIPHMGENKEGLDKLVAMEYIMNWFNKQIDSNNTKLTMSDRVVILLSKTGSGKSSSIAPNLYLRFNKKMRKNIIITQPRVLTTLDIPNDINKIEAYKKPNKDGLKLTLFENLGYQTQEFVRKPLKKGILFTTAGILLQFLKTMDDKTFINRYGVVIIDEAHERSLDIDIILYLMKSLIKRNINNNPPFLILMSATFDINLYAKYFNTKTIFEVIGQTFPITTIYPTHDINNYVKYIVDLVKTIHISNKNDYIKNNPGDILIFVSGSKYIKVIINLLNLLNNELEDKIIPIKLSSKEFTEAANDYKALKIPLKYLSILVNNKVYKPTRRVIISTNIAETGITFDTLKYCIDSGFVTSIEFNAQYNLTMIFNKPVTQAMSKQRMGRIGRKQTGIFYPIYTNKSYDLLTKNNTPSIYVEDITGSILSLISDNVDIDNLDLLSNPSIESINLALYKLFILGAIDNNKKLTDLGSVMNKFRKINLESRKMILSGIYYNVNLTDLIIIASFLNLPTGTILTNKFKNYDSIFYCDDSKYDCFNYLKLKHRLLISCEFIEFLLFYYMFIKIVESNSNNINVIKLWCLDHHIDYNGMLKLIGSIDELTKTVIFTININLYKSNSSSNIYELYKIQEQYSNNLEFNHQIMQIKKCIYEGYKLNLIELHDNIYKIKNMPIQINNKLISPILNQNIGKSILQNKPKYILYSSLIFNYNDKINKYNVITGKCISVLDGFINLDHTFLFS